MNDGNYSFASAFSTFFSAYGDEGPVL